MRSSSSATGNNSLNYLVGIGSNKHVFGLDAVISLFSSSCPILEVLNVVESTFLIVFLMLSIFSVKKLMVITIKL